MFLNVVIGKPLVEPHTLLASSFEDWIHNEQKMTLFTKERNLAKVLVESGIVSSRNEVKRNQPHLDKILDTPDCLEVKWGKKRLYIVVGPLDYKKWMNEHNYNE